MRICIFTDCFLPGVGGAEIAAHNLAKTFTQMGHFTVVVTYNRGNLKKLDLHYKVETMPAAFYRLGAKTLIEKWAIRHYQKKYNFDIINIHKTYAGYAVGLVKDKINVPVVITAHGGDIQKDAELGYGMRNSSPKWEKKIAFAVQKADGVIAISSESVERFRELGAKDKSIHRIANGVDIERFASNPDFDFKNFGLQTGDKIILAVGRYHIKKGYETLIKSIALLVGKTSDVKLVMVGRQSEEITKLVSQLNLEDNVVFIQEQKGKSEGGNLVFPNDFLLSLYKNADVFVSSSIIEGFALVCIEAIAAGLPMVLTQCPGNEDVFEKDGQGGFYVPVGDAEAMASKISELLNDNQLRKQFSKFNKNYASENYSLKTIASKYLSLFEQLVNETPQS